MAYVEPFPQTTVAQENPYLLQATPEKPNQKALRTVDKGVEAVQFDEPLEDAVKGSQEASVDEIDFNDVSDTLGERQAVREAAMTKLGELGRQDLVPQSIAQHQEEYEEDMELAESALAPHFSRIYKKKGAEFLTDDEIAGLAVADYTHDSIAAIMDKQSYLDTGLDILNMAVVPDEAYNITQVSGKNYFMGVDAINTLRDRRAGLSPIDQIKFDYLLQDKFNGIESSTLQTLGTMDEIRDQTGGVGSVVTDYVGAASTVAELAGPLMRIARGFNVMRKVSKLGDANTAQKVVDMAVSDEAVARQIGVPQADAAMSGNPIKGTDNSRKKAIDDFSKVLSKKYKSVAVKSTDEEGYTLTAVVPGKKGKGGQLVNFRRKWEGDQIGAKEPLKNTVFNGTTDNKSSTMRFVSSPETMNKYLREIDGIMGAPVYMDHDEKLVVAERLKNAMEGKDDIEAVELGRVGKDSITMKVTRADGSVDEVDHEFTIDDYGSLRKERSSIASAVTRWLWSPMLKSGKDRKILSDGVVLGSFQRARAQHLYNKAAKEALRTVSGNPKSVEKINGLMQQINGKPQATDYHTLVNEGVGGVKLSEEEFIAFKGIRRLFDHMWSINNNTEREDMILRGLSRVDISGDAHYVKRFSTDGDAIGAYKRDDARTIAYTDEDGVSRSFQSISDEELQKMVDNGYELVKSDTKDQTNWFRSEADDNHSKWALVRTDEIKEIPEDVLPYTDNYIPLSREDANFFIQSIRNIKVDGRTGVKTARTKAWAKTEAEANAYVARIAKELNIPEEEVSKKFQVIPKDHYQTSSHGRTKDDEITLRMNGGLYRGSRSSEEIVYAGDALDGKEIDPLDTLQRAMRYTSDRMSMSRLRLVQRQRWYNSAEQIDPAIRNLPWEEAHGAVAANKTDLGKRAALLDAHEQISAASGIPSKDEQFMSGVLYSLGKNADAKGKLGVAKWFYNRSASGSSVANYMKGATFHAMLGMFNASQFFVQAASMSAALSINPVAGAKAISRVAAASLTDLADDTLFKGELLKDLLKKGVIDEDMANDLRLWRQSGMRESILVGNADYNNAGQYMPLDASMVRRMAHIAGKASTTPYTMGDLASLRTSFFTALEHQKAINPNFRWDDANLQAVTARAEQYRLGMSSANKATYQKGLMGVATQFKSIFTKSMEAYMGSWFTPAEKVRLLTGQVALFGAAGAPIINHFVDQVVDMFTDEDTPTDVKRAYQTGAVGWLLNGVMDVDADAVSRMAIAGDVVGVITDGLFEDTPMIESALGPSFTTGNKILDAITGTMAFGKVMLEDDDLTTPSKLAAIAEHASKLALSVATGPRRMREAYLLNVFKEVRTSSGRTLYHVDKDEAKPIDVMARALGFGSLNAQDEYAQSQAQADYRMSVRDKAEMYYDLMLAFSDAIDNQDQNAVMAYHKISKMVMDDFKSSSERKDIFNAIKALMESRNLREKNYKFWLENNINEAVNNTYLYGQDRYERAMKNLKEE